MDHIEKFEDLVTSIKANGVSNDYLFCKLFPYSLGGDAAYWLKQLPTGSLGSWEETKRAFLCHFYDDARSDDLRNSIQQFTQGPTEAFRSAWVRFRAYQRDCPHHGFSQVQLLGIFLRGVDWRYQMALDSASNGNFKTRSPEEAELLIENLASSSSAKNADFERQKQAVNYIGETGFQGQRFRNQQNRDEYNGYGQTNNFSGNQNSSGFVSKPKYPQQFQSSNDFSRNYGASSYQNPPAPTEQNEMKSMFERILEGQQRIAEDLNGKIDALYTDLNGKIDAVYTELSGKIEALNIHVKKLDTQVAQTAGAVKQQEEILLGKTDANPKYHCNAIMVTSSSEPRHELIDDTGDSAITAQVSIDTTGPCRSTPMQKSEGHLSRTEPVVITTPEPIAERVHKPKLPFPRPRKSKQEMEEERCKAMTDKVMIELSLVDAVKVSPLVKRYVKLMVANGVSPVEGALLTKYISTILLGETPRKRKGLQKKVEINEGTAPEALMSIETLPVSIDANTSTTDVIQSTSVDRHAPSVDRHQPSSDMQGFEKPQNAAELVYKPLPSYPGASEKYNAMVEKISWQVPWVHEFCDMPCVKDIVDKACTKEICLNDAVDLVYAECAAIILSRLSEELHDQDNIPAPPLRHIPKLEDPGKFIVPCSIFGVDFGDALCDSGSTVNLMSMDIAKSLGIADIKTSRMSIKFANASEETPNGCIENLSVKIGDCVMPADFQVVEMKDNSSMPLILGRSFLATAGALVDLPNKRVCLSNVDKNFFYDAIPENHGNFSSYVAIKEKKLEVVSTAASDGQVFSVETCTDITAEYVEDFGPSEKVSKQASKLEDRSGDHIFRTGLQDEGLFTDKLLEEDVFLIETRISELNCRKSANFRATGSVSIDTTTDVDRHPPRICPDFSETAGFRDGLKSASSRAVVKQKYQHPTLHSPGEKQRYASSGPKPPDIINKTFQGTKTVLQITKPRNFRRRLVSSFDDYAGKRSIPPRLLSRPATVPHFLGRSHAPNAYTPPWMKRLLSAKHVLPPSDPPDS